MNSSSIHRVTVPLNEDNLEQLSHLCLLLVAINEACKKRERIAYIPGKGAKDKTLTEFQKFLNKLAMICDTRKGDHGATVTALVCLSGIHGPEYIFTSNFRKEAELEETKSFLSDLLTFVGTNPNKLHPKPLQKQVLWKSFVFNYSKLKFYLGSLIDALEECIDCESHRGSPDLETIKHLRLLQDKGTFSRDISSESTRQKFLSDCESLIKAIHASKTSPFEKILQSRAVEKTADSADWCTLRHYLGRLHSYRLASEIIVTAATSWPDLFKNHRVDYISSARQKFIPTPNSSDLTKIIPIALPGYGASDFQSDIAELQIYELDNIIREQLQNRRINTMVHCEINLHNHLVQKGKTSSTDFWGGTMFIATSKPTCSLCHHYFNSPNNEFEVQTSHMNLYPKWRLPDIYEDQGAEAKERCEELLKDIMEQMRQDLIQMLKQKAPKGKTHDSRTDTHSRVSTRTPIRASNSGEMPSNMQGELITERQAIDRGSPSPSSEDSESYDFGDTTYGNGSKARAQWNFSLPRSEI